MHGTSCVKKWKGMSSEPKIANLQLAKSYRNGQQQRPFTIKMKDSDDIITEPEEVQERWTEYFSNLLKLRLKEMMR